MNTDFRLSVGYLQNPKIKRLRRKFGAEGIVAHMGLLAFTAMQRPDGRLHGMDTGDIADAAGYAGDAEAFVAVMVDLVLLDTDSDGALSVHDWDEHNPWAAEATARTEQARNAAKARWDKDKNAPAAPAEAAPRRPAEHKPAMRPAQSSNANSSAPGNAVSNNQQCSEHKPAMRPAQSSNAPILSSPTLPTEPTTPTTPSDARAEHPPGCETSPGDAECREEVVALLLRNGISEQSARDLAGRRDCETIRRGVEDLPARIAERASRGKDTDDPAGLLFRSIFEGWSRPESVKRRLAEERTAQEQQAEAQRRAEREAQARAAEAASADAFEAAFAELPDDQRMEIEGEVRTLLLRSPLIAKSAKDHPDTWHERPGAVQAGRELRNGILAVRGLVTAVPGVQPPEQDSEPAEGDVVPEQEGAVAP